MYTRAFTITTSGPFFRTTSGSVTGIISITANGRTFPEPGWRDFVVNVLVWWIEAARMLAVEGRCTLNFMDGPYEARAVREGSSVRLTFLSRSATGETPEDESVITIASVVNSVVDAGKSAAAALAASGYIDGADTP